MKKQEETKKSQRRKSTPARSLKRTPTKHNSTHHSMYIPNHRTTQSTHLQSPSPPAPPTPPTFPFVTSIYATISPNPGNSLGPAAAVTSWPTTWTRRLGSALTSTAESSKRWTRHASCLVKTGTTCSGSRFGRRPAATAAVRAWVRGIWP